MYEYRCKILKIIDGTTILISIDLGFNIWINRKLKLQGIRVPSDIPLAKNFIDEVLTIDKSILFKLQSNEVNRYGHVIGDLEVPKYLFPAGIFLGHNTSSHIWLTNIMLRNNICTTYDGQNIKQLDEIHRQHRKLLEGSPYWGAKLKAWLSD